MERLRISDLSFCEDEASDLSQVQGGVASTYARGYAIAKSSSYKVDKNKGTITANFDGALAGALAGAITDGDKAIASVNTSATVS
ncbi:MAG: hypothetical protein RM368_11390 [Nostoc sp. DedSLP03]|uniref:hypothetical protein n=1 Tax=Nostoc sp. DedSLP03 TaxID=3075400 RepID=UPI002AD20802|nr:hypothetical protein [Nostoc sp. DedSLP03]MDZ7965561.1 hypothetical protein [Nostoc sp. DedSLP03]